ncbi:lysophosphatidylserine lipase ABHD12-like [Sebastes umbrosus]|uniref:lysophosphatidylserine lipase ABHD12-like n=1 Tax=Sebastes umbrosus TaxID=72105 RepID=UPI00189FCF28|nr:lysophosphatidylserine lipase ABHD12-like [Sebastes umbrosus]
MKIVVLILIAVYASVPALLYLFPPIMIYIVFSHYMLFPLVVDLSKPKDVLNYTSNFYFDVEEGIKLGVWHTLPASQWEEAEGKSRQWYRDALGDGSPVILYLHGQKQTRALDYRVELVKVLSAAGYHVISFDYRGFGDSTGSPTEAGLTRDSVSLYHWVKNHSRGLVCVWGHSLGTAVATNTVVKLQEQGSAVDALVLHAPFTSMKEIISYSTFTKFYNFLPGFHDLLCNILDNVNVVLANDKNVKILTCPTLFIHSKDDDTVPFEMGVRLFKIALQAKKYNNRDAPVEMITYSADLGYLHNHIYRDPNLPNVIGKFLQNLRE